MTDKNNPPAFPVSSIDGFTQYGMTMRDYFAAAALQGLLSNGYYRQYNDQEAASEAYLLSDAMLIARGES